MTSRTFTLAIDVGKPENVGWASSEHPTEVHVGFDQAIFDQAINRLAAHLQEDGRATIGFEAPIWTPRRATLNDITKARGGVESSLRRAWTANAGACALACGLGLMPWVFERIAKAAPNTKATVKLDQWLERGGLFVWEAFVTGGAKRATNDEDARAALEAFEERWPDLKSDVTPEPAVNLAVAAALASGLAIDPSEIGAPSIVVVARKDGSTEAALTVKPARR
jgi:hypothetical protein